MHEFFNPATGEKVKAENAAEASKKFTKGKKSKSEERREAVQEEVNDVDSRKKGTVSATHRR